MKLVNALFSVAAPLAVGGVYLALRPSAAPITAEPLPVAPSAAASTERTVSAQPPAGYLTPEHTLGDRQSPLNILTSRAREASHQAQFHYKKSKEHVRNLGKTIEVDWDKGSFVEFDGAAYELVQFHFHTPSEHLLDGLTYPMEIHFVHARMDDPDKLLVVGALFKEGVASPLIEHLLPLMPSHEGEQLESPEEIDLRRLFDKDRGYYYYSGSLTTPPFAEVVKWLVLDGVHEASPEQVEKIAGIEGFNARHIQEPHGRTVEHCRFKRHVPPVKRPSAGLALSSPARE